MPGNGDLEGRMRLIKERCEYCNARLYVPLDTGEPIRLNACHVYKGAWDRLMRREPLHDDWE